MTKANEGGLGALPEHHVARPRLTRRLRAASLAVVEAGGGYGKSVLASELAEMLGVAAVRVVLRPEDRDADLVATRLRAAVRRRGLSDSAAAMERGGQDPDAVVDAFLDSIAGERDEVLIIVDEVQHASGTGAALLAALAGGTQPPNRVVLLGRTLPAGLAAVARDPRAVRLTAADMAFTADEVAALYAHGFGRRVSEADAGALAAATGGWAAALVLAAPSLRAEDPAGVAAAIADEPAVVAHLVAEHVAGLAPADRNALVQVAHLPLLVPEIADRLGRRGLFSRVAKAGIAIQPGNAGWWELPGPVQEYLARLAPLRLETARAAAGVYLTRDEPYAAVRTLLDAGGPEEAAKALAGMPSRTLRRIDFVELRTLVSLLPESACRAHPRALLHLARACEIPAEMRLRARLLDEANGAAGSDAELRREADAERARDLARDGRIDGALELAGRTLAEAGDTELRTRARALDTLGRAHLWQRTPDAVAAAESELREASALCRAIGEPEWEAQALLPLAAGVYFLRGQFDEALGTLDRAIAIVPPRGRHRALLLTFRAEVLTNCGRFAESETDVQEAFDLARAVGDRRVGAYAAWEGARRASQTGDATRTIGWLREADRDRHDWFAHDTGVEFLADAADLLDRVGETDLAATYLRAARERRAELPVPVLAAEAVLAARHGDAGTARTLLRQLRQETRLAQREAWRVLFFAALTELRAGTAEAAPLAAAAFREAATLGYPDLPHIREPEFAAQVEAAAAGGGADQPATDPGVEVSVLGQFRVMRGARPLPIPPGKPMQAVKLAAVSGGQIPTEQLIEALWPEVEPESGRKRLRNTLNRLRAACGDLLVREADTIAFAPGVRVDAIAFEEDARKALAAGADPADSPALARAALSRYRRELLPDDPYEDWAALPRERFRRLYIAILELLVRHATATGDLDEALRMLDSLAEIDPHDEATYVHAARLYLAQGRRGPGLAVLDRARRALEELGLEPSGAWRETAAALRA